MTRLCDLSLDSNAITSVSWSERGGLVAVGTQKGYISVWDVAVNKEVINFILHLHCSLVLITGLNFRLQSLSDISPGSELSHGMAISSAREVEIDISDKETLGRQVFCYFVLIS